MCFWWLCRFDTSYLLNHVKTNAVNLSQLKRPATSKLAAIGNQNLVINGARTIGCKIENISAEDLYDKRVSNLPPALL